MRSAAGCRPASPPLRRPVAAAAGHSWHGETFNEGPRQRAYLMGNTGPVNFPVSNASPETQKFINQGIGQLHGFWYFEAERSFRQAATLDPNCAMAYWGMAWANTNNAKRAKGFLAEAVKRKGGITERKRRTSTPWKLSHNADAKKTKSGTRPWPKPSSGSSTRIRPIIEAKALLGQLWLNRSQGTPIASHLAVDAPAQGSSRGGTAAPLPTLSHSFVGRRAAAERGRFGSRCGQAAPSIAHMWHMSGHIFSDLQRLETPPGSRKASGARRSCVHGSATASSPIRSIITLTTTNGSSAISVTSVASVTRSVWPAI